jgi:Gas vesicle synthesis protein GvpL/GvpF
VASGTYVFCLVQSPKTPLVRGAPAGMQGGGRPRALEIERGLWAIVADAPLDRFSPERLERDLRDLESVSRHALAHASVIEFFFRRSPVIPLKLFTLFTEDERARQHLARRGKRLRALFAKLRGLEEWGVRITAAATEQSRSAASKAQTLSGREYLLAKSQLANDAGPRASVKKEIDAALKQLRQLASRGRKEMFPPPARGRAYVAGMSYLVAAKRRRRWIKEATRLAGQLQRRGHRLDLTGPWPPYRFVTP